MRPGTPELSLTVANDAAFTVGADEAWPPASLMMTDVLTVRHKSDQERRQRSGNDGRTRSRLQSPSLFQAKSDGQLKRYMALGRTSGAKGTGLSDDTAQWNSRHRRAVRIRLK